MEPLTTYFNPRSGAYSMAANADVALKMARENGYEDWANNIQESIKQISSSASPQTAVRDMQAMKSAFAQIEQFQKSILTKVDPRLSGGSNGITFTETTDPSGNVVRTTHIGKQGSASQDKREQVEASAKEYAEMKMVPALAESARAITGLISQPQDEGIMGTMGRMAKSAVPFTQAGMTEDRIVAIKDMVALENLTRMRLASPTGGALGAVSDTEGRRLENMLGSLKSNLSPKERIAKLRQFQRMYVDIVYGSDSRLNQAVTDGKLTKEQAVLARQMRDESYNKAAIGDFSFFEPQDPEQVPTGGAPQSQGMNAPTQSPTESPEYNDAMEYYRQMKALRQQR